MSRPEHREFVVVGSGLLGLATSHALGERGRDVLCLEKEEVGNESSGSRGTSRIFRLGYEDPLYVAMASRSLQDWRLLEATSGEHLLAPCSLLNFGSGLSELEAGMRMAGASPELIAAPEVAARFPRLAIGGPALLDLGAGVLRADRALAALRSTMRAELRERVEVTGVADDGRKVSVGTEKGTIEASVVIVCAGGASSQLLRTAGVECRIVSTLEQVAYFGSAADAPGAETSDLANMPVVIERLGAGPQPSNLWGLGSRWADLPAPRPSPGSSARPGEQPVYVALFGLPAPPNAWYKLGIHHSGPEVDPRRARLKPDESLTERLVHAATSLIHGIDPSPRSVERCIYDNTADEDFIIDRVGRIVIGAGTSGHGFKFGPLLGSLLADLATGTAPPMPLDRFSVLRPAVAGP